MGPSRRSHQSAHYFRASLHHSEFQILIPSIINRLLHLPTAGSFFFFLGGGRRSQRTIPLKAQFREQIPCLDLLNLELKAMYQFDPEQRYRQLSALPGDTKFVIIGEIQKEPKRLDVVHRKIAESALTFILPGSGPRKLKQGAANPLAGRGGRV